MVSRIFEDDLWTDIYNRPTIEGRRRDDLMRINSETLVLPEGIDTPDSLLAWLMQVAATSIETFGYVDPTIFAMNGHTIHIFESRDYGSSVTELKKCFSFLASEAMAVAGSLKGFVGTAKMEPSGGEGVIILAWDNDTKEVSAGTVVMKRTADGWGCSPPQVVEGKALDDLRLTFF